MIKKLWLLFILWREVKEAFSYCQHYVWSGKCVFCQQTREDIDKNCKDKDLVWRCESVKWNRGITKDRVSMFFEDRLIEALGDWSKYFVSVKAWLKISLFEHGKRFIKRHLR